MSSIAYREAPCPGTEFETRTLPWDIEGRPPLHRCTTCNRVARTTRPHAKPHRNTRSHDRTMAHLWDIAEPKEEA